jgi:hypothetical protein
MVVPVGIVRSSRMKSIIGDINSPVALGRTAIGTGVADGWASTIAGFGVVDAPNAPSATTVMVAFIDVGWIAQKYWNVPTS